MAKILISSIGTGPSTITEQKIRQYKTAKYEIDGKYYESSFIASVLYQHLKIDEVILIGTVKSMWEAVYEQFCQDRNIEIDFEYYIQLSEIVESANHKSDLNSIQLGKLEKSLGDKSKCIAIKYGLNEREIEENFKRVVELIDVLQSGDELYIDITHSFRSLSLFLFLVLTFINDIASELNVSIKGVYYGMLDISRELNYAPIVNLQSLFDITRWIKGGYSLQNFGNGYLIASLLAEQGEKSLANSISKLSDTLNLNYIPTLRQNATDLKRELDETTTQTPLQYLKPELERFVKRFSRQNIPDSELQLDLARWYFQNKRYATGYIALVESIITYSCEVQNIQDIANHQEREKGKNLLSNKKNTALGELYFKKVNPIRKAIAHASLEERRTNLKTAIDNAMKYCDEASRIFRTKTFG
ncbi:MAG: TIGR02221 family CRISPR-associated protein [Limnospira sp. PMC 1291.21]|uniref:CRISPR-associated protein n=1 Tax=Limnospira indica PCC 8005 TaxID=376219 RepID=A0A9P1NZV7_9CYAN|nr:MULTISPECIES: TIGR02221 family CRISPR-associated protein [Limnospira]MDT9176078.1 TIGR02221 family CRISPR-associated protein [Limnospira sp. PMC 1238.20]MDT9196152.1 TIGR02221 family CRISPR-associated protein [Limnospira sp. PMC 1245.20]MDT9206413.1 TIGR02221 family CRISPR-associated protein [Limnospira sp. PMC 1243.20]MDT9222021.1 TIGR02221 family CRISPR-associated protein [Limnospira sp. PMC 1279.21]MDT9227109.1 TIGR02221 family CRISPR-associated protein [Limnospira sp. PMC 1242.20]